VERQLRVRHKAAKETDVFRKQRHAELQLVAVDVQHVGENWCVCVCVCAMMRGMEAMDG
jgi:hypothetical protein